MTQGREWPAELTRITGRQIRHYRDNPMRGSSRMSAQQLAEAMTERGMPYTRTQVTNLESGRRDTVTVGEVLVFAAVLGVPPVLLLTPIGSDEKVPILPGRSMDSWTAYLALVGELRVRRDAGDPDDPDPEKRSAAWTTAPPDPSSPTPAYWRHRHAERGYYSERGSTATGSAERAERHLGMIAATRVEMARRGWALPALMPDLIDALAEPLPEYGWRQDEHGNLVELSPPPNVDGGDES